MKNMLSIISLAACATLMSTQVDARQTRAFTADLDPLNNSGVDGTVQVIVDYDANLLTVMVTANGVVPDQLHPQHIHGFMENNRNAKCPTAAADQDGDNLITLSEGLPFYGPVLLPLDPFPVPDDSTIHFIETYMLSDVLEPLQNNAIVLHGAFVGGEYVATLPVACGQLKPASNGRGRR